MAALVAAPARAVSPVVRSAVAVRATQAPVLDGKDNDAIWRAAPAITEFQQFVPTSGAAPSFRTDVKVAYDDRYLYVFVRCFDPHPDSIRAFLSRRDVSTPSDRVKITIDSYHDRRTGYEFAVNPKGVKSDFYTFNDAEEDPSWDGVWDVATAVDARGGRRSIACPSARCASRAARITCSGSASCATSRGSMSGTAGRSFTAIAPASPPSSASSRAFGGSARRAISR